jgi:hypothetical protein
VTRRKVINQSNQRNQRNQRNQHNQVKLQLEVSTPNSLNQNIAHGLTDTRSLQSTLHDDKFIAKMVMVPESRGCPRVRAHSMLGAIKSSDADQVIGYFGSPVDHDQEPLTHDNPGESSTDASRLSELTIALQMAGE